MDDQFSVWVGSLSLQCKEETLSDFFGKFGPLKDVIVCRDELGKSRQFGYVNYYSREIAECAATVTNGCKLLGEAIVTKGPSELEKLRGKENIDSTKDYRMYADCLFFIDGRECTLKNECQFRHCEVAKNSDVVCKKWLEKQCENLKCPLRHPRLTAKPVDTDNTVNRCPSHNAFKCFGECGNKDCNTHFLEHSAYLEHVKMAMKRLAQPVDDCVKCQAVFFNQDEKLNHRCYKSVLNPPRSGTAQQFTSTRLQAEKDIVQPQPIYPNKNPDSSNFRNKQFHLQQVTDTKLDKKYSSSFTGLHENKTVSSAFVPNLKHIDHSNRRTSDHLPTQRPCNSSALNSNIPTPNQNYNLRQASSSTAASQFPAAQKGCNSIINLPSQNHNLKVSNSNTFHAGNSNRCHEKPAKELEPVGVFWDFENCQVPKGKSAQAVVQKIRSVFFKEKREVEFMCVCDTSKEKKAVIEELNKAQVTVVHINATSKNAADDKLRQSLRRFAQTYSRPATVVLISGDGNFAMDLSDLRHRHNFQIICLHNHNAASSALLGFAHETHRFDLFSEDLQTFTTAQSMCKPSFSNDVSVSNLPSAKSSTTLKARLTKLSDNCGGKVVAINGNKAIVRFPNSEAAFRARRRLDKEDLFGNILRATLLPLTATKGGDMASARTKQREKTTPVITSNASRLIRPLMDVSLNDGTNSKSWKENQSPNVNPSRNFPKDNLSRNSAPPRFPESPGHMSPQFPHLPGQRFPAHAMFNNLFHPTLHSMFGLRGVAPPSPIPITGTASLIPRPSSPLSPVVGAMIGRSPSPEQQFSGVDLLVTNVNESIPKKEMKKKLASIFREHSKVYSVVLHAKKGAPLRAFVKVPKLMDAHMAISKVSGQIVFGQIVHVSIACERDKELCYLQDEAVTVLQEAPLSWLPLTKFLTNFEKKYRRGLDVRHLEQIQDIVVLNGSAGCQTISLLEGKISVETLMVDTSFATDVVKLLHHFDGVIQLACFPALYWLEFHKEIKLCSTGSLLEELLSRVPNVTVVGNSKERYVQWVKKPDRDASVSLDISPLCSRLIEILEQDHEFKMTFERLQEKYSSSYNEELDPYLFGFNCLLELLRSLTNIVQVKEVAMERYVCLLREYRVKLFEKEMSELLKQQPYSSVLLSNFMASYVKHFGQKFKLSSFGFTRLTDLIKAVGSVAQIEGDGDHRTVTLVHKGDDSHRLEDLDEDQQLHETFHSVDQVKADIFTIVNNEEIKLVNVRSIPKMYESYFCRNFPYDTLLLNEALESLHEPLEVRGTGNDRVVGIFCTTDEDTPSKVDFLFVKTAVETLYECAGYTLSKARFQYLYEQNVSKKKYISKDDARLQSFPTCVVIRIEDKEEIAELRHSYCIRILVEELKQLLASTGDLYITLDELQTQYEQYFQKTFNLKSHGFSCLEDLRDKLNGFMEFTSLENKTIRIGLLPVSRFELQTEALLKRCDGCLSLSRFAPVYQQMYSKPCVVSDYGYTKLSTLINAVPHVARIIGSGPEKVVIAVQRSIPERVCSDMLSVRIIGGSTEDVFSTKKGEQIQSASGEVLDSLEVPAGSNKVNSCNSYVLGERSNARCLEISENRPAHSLKENQDLVAVKNSNEKQVLDVKDGREKTDVITKPVIVCGASSSVTNVHSPAGQGITGNREKVNNFSSVQCSTRTSSSKVRLAANFTFPLGKRK